MKNLTDQFLFALCNGKYSDYPEYINTKVRECLLDYVGVAVAGASLMNEKEQQVSNCSDFSKDSHIIGLSKCVSVSIAALLNGISSHVIELDDGHRIGMLHLGAPVISAMLAVAEREKISSRDFLRGIVVGYEVAIRLACAVQPGCKLKGYHATGTCGTIGAAMSIAAALYFDNEQMKSAFSAATTSAAGLLEMNEGDTELKPYNAGREIGRAHV